MRWFEYRGKVINLSHVVRFKVVEYVNGYHLICIMNATIHTTFTDDGERFDDDYFLKYFHNKEEALQVARDIVAGKYDIETTHEKGDH